MQTGDMETHDELELVEETRFPTKVVVSIVVGLLVISGLVFFYFANQVGTKANVECAYRGGTWLGDKAECIFDDTAGGKQQRVGMVVASIEILVPESKETVRFLNVEIGKAGAASQTFAIPQASNGVISIIDKLGRVHTASGDLVLPFVVQYGGSGTFNYLGLFEKMDRTYVLRDSLLIGDRVAPEALVILANTQGEVGEFTARLSYRDRKLDEPMSAIPTEPRTMSVSVKNHRSDSVAILSRDGHHYKDLLIVKTPLVDEAIATPLSVVGMARGSWFFEGSFPITLVDAAGKTLADGQATASGEWMTAEYVPFSATLTFTLPSSMTEKRGRLILKKDNPSGLKEHDDQYEIPITFK